MSNLLNKTIKIEMNDCLIKPYYKVFGHFFLDHLFILYKIKKWYENEKNIEINSVLINEELLNTSPFVKQFYELLFDKIYTQHHSSLDIIDIGIIMGSDSKFFNYNNVDKIIYLSKSNIIINIPSYVIENGRNITEYNKKMINIMSSEIKQKLNITYDNIKSNKDVLIINRKSHPRRLINLDKLVNLLLDKNFKCNIVSFDEMNLIDQITLISTYKVIIVACGSIQVHISFLHKDCKYIELCENGFRYPNTSIYGYFFDIDTSSITKPLGNEYNYLKNNFPTNSLFDKTTPVIIKNISNDIENEKEFYSKLIQMNCFGIHMVQDIYCENYLTDIKEILSL